MKRILASALLFCFPFILSAQAADIYTIDPTHSYVAYDINHLGFSTQTGKWMVSEGSVTLDEAKPQNSKVSVTIKVSDVITGVPKLDEHLTGPDFFDVTKFPTATFVSDKVTITGKNKAAVRGMLTICGITKPITLTVTLDKMGPNPVTNKQTAGFTATTHLKRSDFGMTALLPWLGDDVKIDIGAEANKAG
jgi:polyisoprenoid-binding protein YceI